ncbi:hypothetical protein CTI14_00865 [Methylobacterium radiotolerans]|nr:hypothetical protein CTI14_00865 [Methylobacterium radiotolerans]
MRRYKERLHADFVQLCKYMRLDGRVYLTDIQGSAADHLMRDTSFGMVVQEGVHCFLIDTVFKEEMCATAYYGDLLRINFYLNKSLFSNNHYNINCIKAGDAILIKNNKEVVFYPPAGMSVFGLNILVDPTILPDMYGLDVDKMDLRFRNAILSHRSTSLASKIELSTRLFGTIETLERCVSKGVLQDKLLKAKTDEIVCEMVYILNNYIPHEKQKRRRLTRSQIIIERIQAVAHHYEQNMNNPGSVDDICRLFGLNKNILTDGFKDIYGMTPGMYARKIALEWAQEQLRSGLYRVQEIASLSGYKSASAFSRAYAAYFGVAPAKDTKESGLCIRSD